MNCKHCQTNPVKIRVNGTPWEFCGYSCRSKYYAAQTTEKRKVSNLQKYGVANVFNDPGVQKKIQQTNTERYGNPHAASSDVVKSRIAQSWGRFAGGHPWSDPSIREKREKTLLQKYGVRHPILHPEIREKIQDTCMKLYGFANASKSPVVAEKISVTHNSAECQDKIRATNLLRYGADHYNQRNIISQLELLTDPDWLATQIADLGQVGVAELLQVSVDTVRRHVQEYHIELPKSRSDFERQVRNFVQSIYAGTVVAHDRSLIGREIDLLLPDRQLALECNGTYWHSELNGRHKNYHLDKTLACQEQGYELIHIWEHDWNNHRELLESRIRSRLGVNSAVGARECEVTDVSAKEAREFLSLNHIQGSCSASVRLALRGRDSGQILALMTFGRSRFDRAHDWELLRYCNLKNHTVTGGASRLFRAFLKSHSASVISYSDRSFNTGRLYEILGFRKIRSSPPAYHYTRDYRTVENRVRYQKHRLSGLLDHYDAGVSEWQNMQEHGWDRIWDCGTDVWVHGVSDNTTN